MVRKILKTSPDRREKGEKMLRKNAVLTGKSIDRPAVYVECAHNSSHKFDFDQNEFIIAYFGNIAKLSKIIIFSQIPRASFE